MRYSPAKAMIRSRFLVDTRTMPSWTAGLGGGGIWTFSGPVGGWGGADPLTVGVTAAVWGAAWAKSGAGWTAWAEDLQDALMRVDPVQPLVEQCSLNHAIYTGKLPFSPLAAKFNWICAEALPVWDSQRNLLCDPSIPHDPLSIIHLNDLKAMPVEINCTDGSVRQTQLTWSAIQGFKLDRVRSGVSPSHPPGP